MRSRQMLLAQQKQLERRMPLDPQMPIGLPTARWGLMALTARWATHRNRCRSAKRDLAPNGRRCFR
jgi:hypothetical protein